MITVIIVTILILWLLWIIINRVVTFIGYLINRMPKENKKNKIGLTKKTVPPTKRKHQFLLPDYSQLLKDFVKELDNVYISILADKNIVAQLKGIGQLNSTLESFVSKSIIFDLVQTYKMLLPSNLTEIRFESSGLAIVASSLMNNLPNYTEKTAFHIAKAHQNGELFYLATQLLDNAETGGNPMKIGVVSKYKAGSNFAFLVFLCVTDNPLLDEYATMLHRFATIIAKADSKFIDFEKEEVLNKIYNLSTILRRNRDNFTIIEDRAVL
jgi:hypothetical protein